MGILYPPSHNALQKTLDAQLDTGHTTAMTLNNVTGIQNKPGVVVINRISTAGTLLEPSRREYILYTAVSGSTLTGLTRGAGGSTDQTHAIGSVVEFVSDVTQMQSIIDAIVAEHEEDGTHSTDAIDAITEIAATLKTGSDSKLVTGTAGTDGYLSKWNGDGDLVDGAELSTDGTLAGNSDTAVPTEKAVKTYVDANAASSVVKFQAYVGSNQSISSGALTDLNLTSESFDTGSDFDTTNKYFTVPADGYYYFYAQAEFAVGGDGNELLLRIKSSGGTVYATGRYSAGGAGNAIVNTSCLVFLSAGTNVMIDVRNNSSNDTITAGTTSSYLFGYEVA